MAAGWGRRSFACGAALFAASAWTSTLAAGPALGEPSLRISAHCERLMGPGRVRCEADVNAPPGTSLSWVDLQIVETPPFLSALKGRIGPADATLKEKAEWRFSFGLVAKARGSGDVRLRVRAVVCRESGCQPMTAIAIAPVVSGS